ncbi:carbonic anhydrase [Dunaliella salina]|uniref:Carbonic anhydrase n=1 Tax=Dunaliella salina TaxID=3046 RepID=A0A172R2D9_DUNSA|nr:carbonic anhydrase 2 [Dunaliella salina]KAF5828547.1 carbonic anhydrase [Dunaliella salina]|eukprot:KAF5828547.1 carbonic anhydrase [Dunaliella salina]
MGFRRITFLGALFGLLSVSIEGRSLTNDLEAEAAQNVGDASSDVAGYASRKLQDMHHPHSYNYEQQGFDWRENQLDNCAGGAQSPINIETGSVASSAEDIDARNTSRIALNGLLSTSYQLTSTVAVNLEQDMQFDQFTGPQGETDYPEITIDGDVVQFTPVQIHFHHFASEHTVDGQIYPLEAHIVMKDSSNLDAPDGQLAVLGILYKYGDADPFIDRLQTAAQNKVNDDDSVSFGNEDVTLDPFSVNVAKDLLPQSDLTYWGYDGSLTTPPCDERVKWHVFKEPRTVSVDQLKVFSDVTLAAHSNATVTNNRVIQPLNGRTVYEYKDTPTEKYNYVQHGFDWRENEQDNCAGDAQSPIDIVTSSLSDPSARTNVGGVSLNSLNTESLSIQPGAAVNIEQDMQIDFPASAFKGATLPTISIDGTERSFRPIQVHWHFFLSEHTVDGIHYPLEGHIVMEDTTEGSSQLAVIGVFYRYGAEDSFINDMQSRVIDRIGSGEIFYGQQDASLDKANDPFTINIMSDLLPSDLEYVGYDGSLTTPPCDETVKWHVFLTPRTVSIEQMRIFAEVTLNAHPGSTVTNNRVIQDVNGRTVSVYNQ